MRNRLAYATVSLAAVLGAFAGSGWTKSETSGYYENASGNEGAASSRP